MTLQGISPSSNIHQPSNISLLGVEENGDIKELSRIEVIYMFSQVCIANYDVFQSLSMSYIHSINGNSRD